MSTEPFLTKWNFSILSFVDWDEAIPNQNLKLGSTTNELCTTDHIPTQVFRDLFNQVSQTAKS